MVDLSLPALLAGQPDVGWLDLPLPHGSKLALFLDDDDLDVLSAIREIDRPSFMAGQVWGAWQLRDPSVSTEQLLDELAQGQSDRLLLSFGSDILLWCEMHSGTMLLIYSAAAEGAVRNVFATELDTDRQLATFAKLRSRISSDIHVSRFERLAARYACQVGSG